MKFYSILCNLLVSPFYILGTVYLSAQSPEAEPAYRLKAPIPAERDGYGIAIASQGDYFLVGAPGYQNFRDAESYGAVYLYEFTVDGPVLVQDFPGPTQSLDRRFGVSVAMGEDFFVVGSANHFHYQTNPQAKIYIYEKQPLAVWQLSSTVSVTDSSLQISDQLISVKIDGSKIYAGFPGMEKVVEVQKVGGIWEVVDTIEDPNSAWFDSFGYSLDVNSDEMLVGAPFDDEFGSNEGAIYHYRKVSGNWILAQKIAPPDPANQYLFGVEVCFSGDQLAVRDSGGIASLFERLNESEGWNWSANISEDADSMQFAADKLLIGETSHDEGTLFDLGRTVVYRYDPPEGSLQIFGILNDSDGITYSMIGGEVELNEDWYLVGSGKRDRSFSGGGPPSGTCLIYPRPTFQTYEDWKKLNFSIEDQGLPVSNIESVVNAHGLSNAVAYYFSISPFDPLLEALPRVDRSGGSLSLCYHLGCVATEATTEVQYSTDLLDWMPLDDSNLVRSFDGDRSHVSIPLELLEDQAFFRIEVIE